MWLPPFLSAGVLTGLGRASSEKSSGTLGDRISALVGTEAQNAPNPILRTRTAPLLVDRYLSVAFGLS